MSSSLNRYELDPVNRSVLKTVLVGLLLVVVFCSTLMLRGWNPIVRTTDESRSAVAPNMPISTQMENQFGIRLLGVDVTAGGGMLQLRYQILDSAKTEALHDAETAPIVIDSAGNKYSDPGIVGHSHIGKTKQAGTTDYILLANAQGRIKSGSFVSIQIGSFTLNQVPVR